MTDRRADNGKAPRELGRKEQLDQLLDGTRTAAEIATILGVKSGYVRATVARQGWQHRLRPGRPGQGGPMAIYGPVSPRPVGRAGRGEPSRAEDERDLGWLAARVAGEAVAALARRDRVGASYVQARITEIRDADLAESGEPPLTVGRAYLWSRGTRGLPQLRGRT